MISGYRTPTGAGSRNILEYIYYAPSSDSSLDEGIYMG